MIGAEIPFLGFDSAFGVAKQVTLTAFATATSFLEFNSESLTFTREEKKIESLNSTRDYTKRFQGSEMCDGSVDFDLNVASDACMHLIKQAMGGTVTSVTGGGADMYTHTIRAGDMENNATAGAADMKAVSISVRRGDTNTWDMTGMRINSLSIAGEIGETVKVSAEFIGIGASVTSTIPTIVLTDEIPQTFIGVSIKTGATITSLTEECFTSFELSLANNIDGDQRCLGSRARTQLPVGRREVSVSLGQRFDTMTAWNRFIDNTMTAIQINLEGSSTIGSTVGNTVYSMYINLPRCYLNSNQPQVGGPDVLTQDLEFSCLRETTLGYAIQMVAYNATANYD